MARKPSDLSHPKYRADIDGLRAIAVISVVIFHAFPELIKGGFIGVDIFFVISGFLISTIIFENLDKGTFSFSEFYARRVKRIFPTLLLVLISVLFFGWFVLLADEYKQLGKHVASGAGFISNLTLWSEAGYFDNSAETKPLLHLWSLGIEEQFYIVWPLLLWFAWKQKFNLITLIILVASLSLYLNIANIQEDAVATFYSPQTRFWELLAGSLLAWLTLYCRNDSVVLFKSKMDVWLGTIIYHKNSDIEGRAFANFCSFIGIGLLFYGFYRIDEKEFPGIWAIIPVLGAVLTIAAGTDAWINRKILSAKLFVWFGLISYPLYLWHWPLFSFARITENDTPSVSIRLYLIVLSVILAWLTCTIIEKNIRFSKKRAVTLSLLFSMAVVGVSGIHIYSNDGFLFGKSAEISQVLSVYDSNYSKKIAKEWRSGKCFLPESKDDIKYFDRKSCLHIDKHKVNVLLLGDSHAAHLYKGLKDSFPYINFLQATASGCKPLYPLQGKKRCTDLIDLAVKMASKNRIDAIILSGRWDSKDVARFKPTLQKLTAEKNQIFIFGPTMEYKRSLPSIVASNLDKGENQHIEKNMMRTGVFNVEKAIISAVVNFENVRYFSVLDSLCAQGRCTQAIENTPIAFDYGHFTYEGAIYSISKLQGLSETLNSLKLIKNEDSR